MRVKQLWDYVPLPAKLKLLWDRLMFSRLTTAYFIFSVIHCIIQVGLQSRAFSINAKAAAFLYDLSAQGNAINGGVPVFDGNNNTLQLCPGVPYALPNMDDCKMVWGGKTNTSDTDNLISSTSLSSSIIAPSTDAIVAPTSVAPGSVPANLAGTPPAVPPAPQTNTAAAPTVTVFVTPGGDVVNDEVVAPALPKRDIKILASDQDGKTIITLNGEGFDNTQVTKDCLWALAWPVSILDYTKREDIVFIAFQFWVLGMSIVALLNESIPHIFASLLTHILAASWGAFQITHTASFRSNFNKVVTEGVCNVSLLPRYWNQRSNVEFPSLALNGFALILSAWFTWKLVKLFGWQTFKRVGASLTINRVYMLVLIMSIALQLSFFFMAAAVSLWIDNLFNGIASTYGSYNTLYKASAFSCDLLLIPWLMTGWFAVRKELRVPMFVFLFFSFLYLAGWGVMFLADTFRWTFTHWYFFGLVACMSMFLTIMALVLGVICRYNFGKGLPHYLNAKEPLDGDDFQPVYSPSDLEKVDFPSNEKPIPTYSATFGKGNEVPPPSQMFPSRMGPRFFNRSAEPFETPRVSPPPHAMVRAVSDVSVPTTVSRSDTQKSFGSLASYYSYSSTESGGHSRNNSQMNGKRWVIE